MKIVPIACRSINTPFPADEKTSGKDDRDKATDPHFLRKVAELIRVHQNNDIAVAFGIVSARILQSVISNAIVATPPPKTLLQILDDCYDTIATDFAVIFDTSDAKMATNLKLVQDSYQRGKSAATEYKTLDDFLLELSHEKMKDQPDSPFYDFAARSCALPGSFIGPMYQLYKMASSSSVITGRNYMEAIRENIFAAGDTCSRGVFVGSVLGAAMTTTSPNSDKVDKMFEAAWMKVENETRREIVFYSKSIVEHSGTIHRLDADAEL
jgi:ADP-ribosylglycohydrolase